MWTGFFHLYCMNLQLCNIKYDMMLFFFIRFLCFDWCDECECKSDLQCTNEYKIRRMIDLNVHEPIEMEKLHMCLCIHTHTQTQEHMRAWGPDDTPPLQWKLLLNHVIAVARHRRCYCLSAISAVYTWIYSFNTTTSLLPLFNTLCKHERFHKFYFLDKICCFHCKSKWPMYSFNSKIETNGYTHTFIQTNNLNIN